ncbi:MAG TPA: sortase [Gammaproteobacteria bacterium]
MRGRWIEYGAWLTGIALLIVFGGARLWAENERVRGLEALRAAQSSTAADLASIPVASSDRAAASTGPSAQPSAASRAAVDQTLWSEKRAREYAKAVTRPGRPAGALRIPSIGLEVPVYSGTSELNLNRGAGHIEGTAPLGADGNVGIAAHRDGFFRGLERLHIDADVLLEVEARTLRYRVVEMRIVRPTDVHVLGPTETPSVTLVTCYPFYFVGNAPERYVVRAELVEPADGLAATSLRASAR